jgi:serine/threonine-protein kinase
VLGTARVQCYDRRVRPRSPEEISLHTEAAGSAPPDAFGPFRVLHQIGAGALGPVFRAYDPEQDKLVAVKLFRLDLPPERVHEFVASLERIIAADLTHSAIAAPLATGIVQASAYLAQDFVAADSLDTVVREHGPAPAGEALRIVTQLAGALDFAAVVGIVHGALHPRDVLICPDDVRLTGLGIARALESAGAQAPVRRPYAAPERADGASPDRRADVYSLAALAHELLWGRRMTASGSETASSLADLAGARMDALRAAFTRALAEDPGARFGSALEFAGALKDSFIQSSVVSPRSSVVTPQSTVDGRLSPVAERPPSVERPLPPDNYRATTDVSRLSAPDSRADLLPLEIPTVPDDAVPPMQITAPPPAPVAQAPAGDDDLVLRRGAEARFDDVEIASPVAESVVPPPPVVDAGLADRSMHRGPVADPSPAVKDAPAVDAAPADPPAKPARTLKVPPAGDLTDLPHPATLPHLAHSAHHVDNRSAIWPLSLALMVGIALGFAGGYWLGQSGTQNEAGIAASATAGSETEVPIRPDAAPERPAEMPPVSAAPPAAVPSAVEPSAAPRTPPPVETAKPKADPVAVARTGRITVRTNPAGARVLIDGKDVGKTPLTIPNLARGTHNVRVMRDGYASMDRRVVISAGDPTTTLTLNLARTPAARGAAPATTPAANAARDQSSLLV